ncbi:RaxX family RiPP [Xanthomonas perforans]
MNLSKKSPTNGAQALQRPAGAKGQLEPLDQRLWKHVGGGG